MLKGSSKALIAVASLALLFAQPCYSSQLKKTGTTSPTTVKTGGSIAKPQKPDGTLDAGVHFKYDLKANKEGRMGPSTGPTKPTLPTTGGQHR
jgi:hypothetical protein